jgi:molecular chaperone DnaK (HSP70)
MRALSIDFGTSNTVAFVGGAGGGRALLFDGSPLLPSAVYLGSDGAMLVGRDAERNARVDPGRFEPNPKRRIDDGTVLLGETELPATHLISVVLNRVLAEAHRQLGGEPLQVRMTHPARWGSHRRSALTEAAASSGMSEPQLIIEPVAAASYFTSVLGAAVPPGRSLAIYDLGGGTFDATVVRRTVGGFEVLAEGGIPDVGGLDFDYAIIEHLGSVYGAADLQRWGRLMSPMDGSDRRHRRMLAEDARAAKEALSRNAQADLHLPALEIDAHLTRDELEQLIRPHLQRTVDCLRTTITSARLAPGDLVGIFLVGGSSRIPLAAHLIHSQLGVAPTTLEQPETVVAEGALRTGGAPEGLPPLAPPPSRPALPPVQHRAPPRPPQRPALPAPRQLPPPPGQRNVAPIAAPFPHPLPPVRRPAPAPSVRPVPPGHPMPPPPMRAPVRSGPRAGVIIGALAVLILTVVLLLLLVAVLR